MENTDRIGLDALPDGKVVSTVRLPLLHIGGQYETMVFPGDDEWTDLACERYHSAEDARTGHAAIVAEWTRKAVTA